MVANVVTSIRACLPYKVHLDCVGLNRVEKPTGRSRMTTEFVTRNYVPYMMEGRRCVELGLEAINCNQLTRVVDAFLVRNRSV